MNLLDEVKSMTQEQIDSFLIEAMRNAGYKTVKLEDGKEVSLDDFERIRKVD